MFVSLSFRRAGGARSGGVALLASVVASASVMLAQPALGMEAYVALSRTAKSVTGNIRMDDFQLVFQNGRKLVFDELVGDTFKVDGKQVNASVYSVKDPADPVLLNGNRLCGQGRVTYVASWGVEDMVLAVFTTQDVPDSAADMCASYTYRPK